MNPVKFQKLVRRSEQEAQKNPKAFYRHVRRFAMLGLLYVAIVVLLAALIVGAGIYMLFGYSWVAGVLCVLTGCLLPWVGLRVLRLRVRAMPQGIYITRNQAPDLFAVLDKIQHKLRAPAIDKVMVTDEYAISVNQYSSWNFFGKSTLVLSIGLPLVLSISTARLLVILAREYAHFRRRDDQGLARMYRLRIAMQRLLDYVKYVGHGSWLAAPSYAVLNWFGLRFLAKSAVLARQEEYLADARAVRLYGADISSAALIEMALLRSHVSTEHLRQFWQGAAYYKHPPQLPYAWLAARQLHPPTAHAMREAMYQIKNEVRNSEDFRPRMSARLKALHCKLAMPEPSIQHAGRLLGYGLQAAIAHYDRLWWQKSRQTWGVLHIQAQRWLTELHQLQARQKQLSIAELHRLAQLLQRTRQQAQADMVYIHMHRIAPLQPHALWHDIISRAERAELSALPKLAQLASHHPEWRERACVAALDLLERNPQVPNHAVLTNFWRHHQAELQALEERFRQEMSQACLTRTTGPHELSVYEQQNFIESAQRLEAPVQRMWLLRNHSRVMPWRVMLLAIVEPVRGHEDDILWADLNEQLDAPGQLLCAPLDWWLKLPDSRPLLREDAIYDQIRHHLQAPNRTDTSSVL